MKQEQREIEENEREIKIRKREEESVTKEDLYRQGAEDTKRK
jgi:hypothetical protein